MSNGNSNSSELREWAAIISIICGIITIIAFLRSCADNSTGSPEFVVQSSDWSGQCTSDSCTMNAIIENTGGRGSGTVNFQVYAESEGQLATCSAILSDVDHNDETQKECTATSADLQAYFTAHPTGTVKFNVTASP